MHLETPAALPDGGDPRERWLLARPLLGTAGQAYVERRGIPVDLAERAARFDPDWGGRAAVLAPMVDPDGIRAVHGRYLEVPGRLGKMLTVGELGGVVVVGDGWRADPVVLVEGLFDALSVATCGGSAVATIGRWAPFLVDALAGRRVWLALDATRPGDAEAARIAGLLPRSEVRRIRPPGRSKDWNTALVERGRAAVRKALEGR